MTSHDSVLRSIPGLEPNGDGFHQVDLFDRRTVRALRRALRVFGLPEEHGFFASNAHATDGRAEEFDAVARPLVRPALMRVLPGYEPFMVVATSKGRRCEDDLKFHQDWSFTDERTDRVIFAWCPLVSVRPGNGTLRVVPGSQAWTEGIRPSTRVPATEAHQAAYLERSVLVSSTAGRAVLFDPALVHGSGPNPTRRIRPAITIACRPVGSRLLHFHEADDGSLQGSAVDERFFLANPYGCAPVGYPRVDPWAAAVRVEDFASALSRSSATHPGRVDAP